MESLKIKGYEVEVDYAEELEPYMDRLDRVRIRGEKIQACSPFRYEKNPSFAVNIENGTWVDSGADEEGNRKGNFISLLAFFRGEDYEETADYLLEKYTHILDDVDTLHLNLNLQLEAPEVSILGQEKYEDVIGQPSDYLRGRGVTEATQKTFETGIGRKGDSVAIPWHDVNGRIINIKYRSMRGKEFWFTKGGQPIKNHVYGLFLVKKLQLKEVWAVESEIDCLYLWANGIPAIAFGGASINPIQKKLILTAGIERLVLSTDNDIVGQRFAKVLHEEFNGYMNCYKIFIPNNKKDMNDLTAEELTKLDNTKVQLGFKY